MTADRQKTHLNRLWWYLILAILLSVFCYVALDIWLLPYSIAHKETGVMTVGYLLYAAIGLLFSTPTPFVAVLIISLFMRYMIGTRFSTAFRAACPPMPIGPSG